MAYLDQDGDPPIRHLLVGRRLGIGRDPANDIVLSEDQRVSRRHAELEQTDGRWVLRDCQSRNGTLVNQSRVAEYPLRFGDEIRIGSTVFRFGIELDPFATIGDTGAHARSHVLGSGDLPSGVVTFMLTDVVGSTRLWEGSARAMSAALTTHDRILSEAVAHHGGVLLKARGEGDSTFSVFFRATHAASAALDAQAGLTRAPWPEGCVIKVRMAVHTGEAEERDGDYYGRTVNRAARLRAVADAGQILVSQPTADILADHLPPDAFLLEMGSMELRDLDRPESVWLLTNQPEPEAGVPPAVTPAPTTPVDSAAPPALSEREREILGLLASGATDAQIAERLFLSVNTVRSHLERIRDKTGARRRSELARYAIEAGLVTRHPA